MKILMTASILLLFALVYIGRQSPIQIDSLVSDLTPTSISLPTRGDNVSTQPHPVPPSPVEPLPPVSESILLESISLEDEQQPTNFSNIFDFIQYIESSEVSDIDLFQVVNYVNLSTEAFEYIKSSFHQENKLGFRQTVLQILDRCNHTQKVDIALELTQSESPSERKIAYAWLSLAADTDKALARLALIKAIETEEDTDLLVDLISISVNTKNTQAYSESTISRIKNLSFHPDEYVSTQAILAITRMAKPPETMDFLISHLENSPLHSQLAAINALKLFNYPSDTAMMSLNNLISNPSVPQIVRAQAVSAIVAFENYSLYSEVNVDNFRF